MAEDTQTNISYTTSDIGTSQPRIFSETNPPQVSFPEINPSLAGAFNITTTPLSKVHQVATPSEILNSTYRNSEPRTKSERSTKAYVGKIPTGLSDYLMEQIFLECGKIISWKRTLDSSGKPLAFGFVEFLEVEGMLRWVRLLNGLQVLESRLLIRIDQSTESFVKEWSDLKRAEWERKRMDNELTNEQAVTTWEESVTAADTLINNNIRNILQTLDSSRVDDPVRKELDKEHPREQEREKRSKARARDAERHFREKEREWTRHEEQRQREHAAEEERHVSQEIARQWQKHCDLNYNTRDEHTHRQEYGKKYRDARTERRQKRKEEIQKDKEDADAEWHLLFPGIASKAEKQFQAIELEQKRAQESAEGSILTNESGATEIRLTKPERPKNLASVFQQPQPINPSRMSPKAVQSQSPEVPPAIKKAKIESPIKPTITREQFEEKVTHLKRLLHKVPNHRRELYSYPLNYELLKKARIFEKRLVPFLLSLTKKILGEEERGLLMDFIVKELNKKTSPTKIQSKLAEAIDTEAPGLTKRMWRMLIFEQLKLSSK